MVLSLFPVFKVRLCVLLPLHVVSCRKLRQGGDSLDQSFVNGVPDQASVSPSQAASMRSRTHPVAGCLNKLGLSADHSSSSEVTPLSLGPVRTARNQTPATIRHVSQQSEQQQSSQHKPVPHPSSLAPHRHHEHANQAEQVQVEQPLPVQQQPQSQSQRPLEASLTRSHAERRMPLSSRGTPSKHQTAVLAAASKRSKCAPRAKTVRPTPQPSSHSEANESSSSGSAAGLSLRSKSNLPSNGQGQATASKPTSKHVDGSSVAASVSGSGAHSQQGKAGKRPRDGSPSPGEPSKKVRRSSSTGSHRKADQELEIDHDWKRYDAWLCNLSTNVCANSLTPE